MLTVDFLPIKHRSEFFKYIYLESDLDHWGVFKGF